MQEAGGIKAAALKTQHAAIGLQVKGSKEVQLTASIYSPLRTTTDFHSQARQLLCIKWPLKWITLFFFL